MAARVNRPFHNDKTREKIKSSQLVNALNNHVLGKNEMSASQVRAAEILLRKTVPDLSAIQYQDDEGKAMAPAFVMTVNAKTKR